MSEKYVNLFQSLEINYKLQYVGAHGSQYLSKISILLPNELLCKSLGKSLIM